LERPQSVTESRIDAKNAGIAAFGPLGDAFLLTRVTREFLHSAPAKAVIPDNAPFARGFERHEQTGADRFGR